MKYKGQKNNIYSALSLTKEQVYRLEKVIVESIETVESNSNQDMNLDEVSVLIAPHVLTPEEAWFCAMALSAIFREPLNRALND